MIVAENPSRTLYKISEIYDRIAFAGVGKYNEFQSLKIGGVRLADLKGYQYSPEDVNAGGLANAYAQTLGQVFTHEMKPYEVEILVASVGATEDEPDQLFHILYDGTVMDEQGFTVLGGEAERIADALAAGVHGGRGLADAVKLGAKVARRRRRAAHRDPARGRVARPGPPGRAFRRIKGDELDGPARLSAAPASAARGSARPARTPATTIASSTTAATPAVVDRPGGVTGSGSAVASSTSLASST